MKRGEANPKNDTVLFSEAPTTLPALGRRRTKNTTIKTTPAAPGPDRPNSSPQEGEKEKGIGLTPENDGPASDNAGTNDWSAAVDHCTLVGNRERSDRPAGDGGRRYHHDGGGALRRPPRHAASEHSAIEEIKDMELEEGFGSASGELLITVATGCKCIARSLLYVTRFSFLLLTTMAIGALPAFAFSPSRVSLYAN